MAAICHQAPDRSMSPAVAKDGATGRPAGLLAQYLIDAANNTMSKGCQVDFYVLQSPRQAAPQLACRLAMRAWENGSNICVAVSDDGVGMEPGRESTAAASGGSYGLFSIRERFTGLGGAVTITKSDLGGAKVLICAPIRQSEETS